MLYSETAKTEIGFLVFMEWIKMLALFTLIDYLLHLPYSWCSIKTSIYINTKGLKMTIIINEVTKENLNDILKLSITDNQKSFIETPQQCLEEAKECSYFKPVGLYWNNSLVGFAMYGFFPEEGANGRVWLDRFLIDSTHQGLGLGSIMLSALIQRLEEEFMCNEIYLSIIDDNQAALHLYKKFDFTFNGEVDNNEKIMVKSL